MTADLRRLLDESSAAEYAWVLTDEPPRIAWMIREAREDGSRGPQIGNVILREDAALIVAAVNALPALLDVAEAARALLAVNDGPHHSTVDHVMDVALVTPALREALARLEEA